MAHRKGKIIVKANYIVEDLPSPPRSQIKAYRRKRVDGKLLTVAILKGGGSRVTSIWRPKEGLAQARARALRRLR